MSAPKPISSILDTAGATPVVELQRIAEGSGRRIFAKCELFGPTQSHKDRSVRTIMDRAKQSGELKPGQPVIEASTGSFGIALAQWCAVNGHPLTVILPERASLERRETLKLYGAKFELVAHPRAALQRLQALQKDVPEAFLPMQLANEVAIDGYREGFGTELVEQIQAAGGRIDAFVATASTGALIAGTKLALKAAFPEAIVWGVEPDQTFDVGMGVGLRSAMSGEDAPLPPALAQNVRAWLQVTSAAALEMKERLAREEGLLCGISSGFNVVAALGLSDLPEDAHVWTVLPDTGERYFSLESLR
ncbi:MAG: PLP-dependent cysteine synthase family protein [Myxococcaceae bacterium]